MFYRPGSLYDQYPLFMGMGNAHIRRLASKGLLVCNSNGLLISPLLNMSQRTRSEDPVPETEFDETEWEIVDADEDPGCGHRHQINVSSEREPV